VRGLLLRECTLLGRIVSDVVFAYCICSDPHKALAAAQPSPQCQNILSSDEADSTDFDYGLPPTNGNPYRRCVALGLDGPRRVDPDRSR
jgi:hypothetical protein